MIKNFLIFVLAFSAIPLGHDPVIPPQQSRAKKITDSMHIFSPRDDGRIFDCVYHFDDPSVVPLYSFDFMHLYDSANRSDYKNGLMSINSWPVLISIYNYRAFGRRLFIGLRGLDWSITKSTLTPELRRFVDMNYPQDPILMPDNYRYTERPGYIESTPIQSICGARTYPFDGFIGNEWRGLQKGGGWRIIDAFFPEATDIFIVGYSNGSAPRNQLIETLASVPSYEGSDLDRYIQTHQFIYADVDRLKKIVDIETNYGSMMDLAMLLKTRWGADKLYYASCNLDASPIRNHIFLIQTFGLIGYEMRDGVISYRNSDMSIVIDIVPRAEYPHYRHGSVDLERETRFIHSAHVKDRVVLNHNSIIRYSFDRVAQILKDREMGTTPPMMVPAF